MFVLNKYLSGVVLIIIVMLNFKSPAQENSNATFTIKEIANLKSTDNRNWESIQCLIIDKNKKKLVAVGKKNYWMVNIASKSIKTYHNYNTQSTYATFLPDNTFAYIQFDSDIIMADTTNYISALGEGSQLKSFFPLQNEHIAVIDIAPNHHAGFKASTLINRKPYSNTLMDVKWERYFKNERCINSIFDGETIALGMPENIKLIDTSGQLKSTIEASVKENLMAFYNSSFCCLINENEAYYLKAYSKFGNFINQTFVSDTCPKQLFVLEHLYVLTPYELIVFNSSFSITKRITISNVEHFISYKNGYLVTTKNKLIVLDNNYNVKTETQLDFDIVSKPIIGKNNQIYLATELKIFEISF